MAFLVGGLQQCHPTLSWPVHVILNIYGFGYLIFVIVSYSIIVYKLHESRKKFKRKETDDRVRFRKEYLIPTLIIMSFLVLYGIPSIIYTYTKSALVYKICMIVQHIGLLTDALIYVFLSKQYRGVVAAKCCPCLSGTEVLQSKRGKSKEEANDSPGPSELTTDTAV